MIIGNYELGKAALRFEGDTEIVFTIHRLQESENSVISIYFKERYVLCSLDLMDGPRDWSPRWQDSIPVPEWMCKFGEVQAGDSVIYTVIRDRSTKPYVKKHLLQPVARRRLLLTADAGIFARKLPNFRVGVLA